MPLRIFKKPADERPVVRIIKLPRHRLRKTASKILSLAPACNNTTVSSEANNLIKIICVSDTHNNQPVLPNGDLLLDAGDLTETGTFDEIQAQLNWLNSQPHPHKVIIAGNHDILFDEQFLRENPTNHHVVQVNETSKGRTAKDLNFGRIVYLQDEAITLDFLTAGQIPRSLKIYGSPRTPMYGKSAFQYPVPHGRAEFEDHEDAWDEVVPQNTDILLVHGPPWKHLDGALRSGCLMLAKEVARVRPRLVVFGHIHVGYGVEEVRLDGLRARWESVEMSAESWEVIPGMIAILILQWLQVALAVVFPISLPRQSTKFVNAAVVGGEGNELKNDAVVAFL